MMRSEESNHFYFEGTSQMLAFFQESFQGSRIYCYPNFFCYANFSIVFGPNFRGGQKSLRGGLSQGVPHPVEKSQDGRHGRRFSRVNMKFAFLGH